MTSERLQFANDQGQMLAASLDHPDGDCHGAVLFAHCFTCHRNYRLIRHIARAFTAAGFALLRFDLRGLGDSQGAFPESNFSTAVADTLAASELLASRFPGQQIFAGHSLGGAQVLAAAADSERCAAVITINAPDGPDHLYQQFAAYHQEIDRAGEAEIAIAGVRYRITAQMLADFHHYDMAAIFRRLSRPVLVFQAEQDGLVPMAIGERLFASLAQPKSFVSLVGMDHLLTAPQAPEEVGGLAALWARQVLRALQDG